MNWCIFLIPTAAQSSDKKQKKKTICHCVWSAAKKSKMVVVLSKYMRAVEILDFMINPCHAFKITLN